MIKSKREWFYKSPRRGLEEFYFKIDLEIKFIIPLRDSKILKNKS